MIRSVVDLPPFVMVIVVGIRIGEYLPRTHFFIERYIKIYGYGFLDRDWNENLRKWNKVAFETEMVIRKWKEGRKELYRRHLFCLVFHSLFFLFSLVFIF